MINEGPLGRNYPKHFEHVAKYALTDQDTVEIQAVAPGVNWYENFDNPQQGTDGKWRIGDGAWKQIRGGHCFCLCPPIILGKDGEDNWRFYNQGEEGACEGFGHARRFALKYGRKFHAFHLYDDGQRIEGTFEDMGGSADAGSTNDAICQALKKWGIHTQSGSVAHETRGPLDPHPIAVASYKWATTADQILRVLGITSGGEIPLLNSWGEGYPHVVYISPESMERLMREGGECDVLTD